MMRIFVGIDLSDEAREMAAEYIDGLRREFPNTRVGWERAEKLHLTLKFLGEIDEDQLGRLKNAVSRVVKEVKPFGLEISDTGVFPQVEKPRVLWLGVSGNIDALNDLYQRIETECEKEGFPREQRKFNPHLTIGRVRQPQNGGELAKQHLQNSAEPAGMQVSELVIFLSTLQPTGSIFKKLFKFRLGE